MGHPEGREGEAAQGGHTAGRLHRVICFQVKLGKRIGYFVNELNLEWLGYQKKLISDLFKNIVTRQEN